MASQEEEAKQAFYALYEALDDLLRGQGTQKMGALWHHADYVTSSHPFGDWARGWAEVWATWEEGAAVWSVYKGHAERILKRVRDQNLTLRQAALSVGERRQSFVGSPKTVADEIERWFVERAADGFNVQISRPGEFKKFREQVVPILQ